MNPDRNRAVGNSRVRHCFSRKLFPRKGEKLLNRIRNRVNNPHILLAMPVFAQNNTGIISGRVTDPSGAVVPNAQVKVTQIETGVEAPARATTTVLFRVVGLLPGTYKVTITATGFKK